jgi:hypothetical protein
MNEVLCLNLTLHDNVNASNHKRNKMSFLFLTLLILIECLYCISTEDFLSLDRKLKEKKHHKNKSDSNYNETFSQNSDLEEKYGK